MSEDQAPQKVPARRRTNAGPVDIAETGEHIEEGQVYGAGVWPWELTEAHGWEDAGLPPVAPEPAPPAPEPEPERPRARLGRLTEEETNG